MSRSLDRRDTGPTSKVSGKHLIKFEDFMREFRAWLSQCCQTWLTRQTRSNLWFHSPVPCSNDQCEEIISRRDKEIHENKVCDFRRVNCDYCGQIVLYKNFMQHTCPARKEIREMKATMADMQRQMNKLCASQEEGFKVMQNMMSNLVRIERKMPQRSEASHARSDQELQAEIVVAGGLCCKSVEVFNVANKTWRPLSEMNECRGGASSVIYQDHIIVTGGYFNRQYLDSVQELNLSQQDGHWVKSQFKLPMLSAYHACVVLHNRLLVIGGEVDGSVYDKIHEIQLTPPYTSKLLTKMPRPICHHGAEIVNDKVYIIGGRTACYNKDATDTVLMFDPATNTCTELMKLPYPVFAMATVTWKDNVVVLGGEDEKANVLNSVILYNVTTGSHRMLPEMTKKRCYCTAVIIGDNIVTMG
ncbi:kinase, partial [Paramuricea clavata]